MATEESFKEYTINQTWDGRETKDNAHVHIRFSKSSSDGAKGLIITVDAPLYKDPELPKEIPVGSVSDLYNYEVVEVFLLCDSACRYLEVELAPTGHYLVLELNGDVQVIRNELPLTNFTTSVSEDGTRWKGTAFIPEDYIPPNVNRFNAYAIHKSDPNRVYMSLFPVPQGKYENPNFHRRDYFQPIDLPKLLE